MIKYMRSGNNIRKISVLSETDKFVTLIPDNWSLTGRKMKKVTAYEEIFDSFDEAKNNTIEGLRRKIIGLQEQLKRVNADLDKIELLQDNDLN